MGFERKGGKTVDLALGINTGNFWILVWMWGKVKVELDVKCSRHVRRQLLQRKGNSEI